MSSSVVNAILTVVHLNLYEITLQITSYCLRYNLNIKYEKTWHSTPRWGKKEKRKIMIIIRKNYYALYVYLCYVSYIEYAWIFWWIYTVLSTDYIFLLVCDRLLELSWPTYSSDRLMNRLNPGKTLQGTSTDPVRMWMEEVDPSTNLSFSW